MRYCHVCVFEKKPGKAPGSCSQGLYKNYAKPDMAFFDALTKEIGLTESGLNSNPHLKKNMEADILGGKFAVKCS